MVKLKKGEDVDHVHDLQLGGIDNPSNMSGLDRSVNRSLGKQINHRVKSLSNGATIRKVTIKD